MKYLLCAICPVSLSKPGLGYREDENRIGPRIRDWVVGVPDRLCFSGIHGPQYRHSLRPFLYPRYQDTPCRIYGVWSGCGTKLTATEKKLTFQNIVKEVIGEDENEGEALFLNIQGNLNDMIPVTEDETTEPEPVVMTSDVIAEVLTESGVAEEQVAVIEKVYEDGFHEELPDAGQLVDPKLVEANGKRKEKLALVSRWKTSNSSSPRPAHFLSLRQRMMTTLPPSKPTNVILRVKPEKVAEAAQMIDGQKCLVIPMEEDEHAAVNGVNTTI